MNNVEDELAIRRVLANYCRYLDRWEKRAGNWAISVREHVLDMQTIHQLDSPAASRGYVNEQSRRDEQDASYQLLNRS